MIDLNIRALVTLSHYFAQKMVLTADLTQSKMVKSGGASAHSAAKAGYAAMMRAQAVIISDPKLRFMINWVFPWFPRRFLAKMVGQTQMP